jgi:hypothetical protein
MYQRLDGVNLNRLILRLVARAERGGREKTIEQKGRETTTDQIVNDLKLFSNRIFNTEFSLLNSVCAI